MGKGGEIREEVSWRTCGFPMELAHDPPLDVLKVQLDGALKNLIECKMSLLTV